MKGRNMVKFQTLCRSAIVIWIWSGFSALGTVYHSDGSVASVQGLHDQVLDGDTITLPNGSFSWTGTLHLTKAVTIKGNTDCNVDAGTCTDATVVIDNLSNRNNPLISIDANGGQRITGIKFESGSTSSMYNGGIRLEHGTNPVRIDHCGFINVYWQPVIGWYDYNYGVIDHCVQTQGHGGIVYIHMGAHGNGGDMGDYSFENPAGFGGTKFLFIETNWFEHGPDITVGGKGCVRYNHIDGTHGVSDGEVVSHGTARTYTKGRGGRCYEVYNNNFRYNNDYKGIDGPDSGSACWHDNTWTNNGLHLHQITSQVYRAMYSFGSPFFGADGRNPWDSNDPHGLYDSGTFTGALVDSSKHWTVNQWSGYSLRRPSDGATASIVSNTANTLTVGQAYNQNFATGNQYEIRRVLRVLDQPGLGAGAHINRASPAWPNQASEPMYSWRNKNLDNNTAINFDTTPEGSFTILAGRDYFNDTPMPGYTPYTYPHPLVQGGQPSPTPTPTPTATGTPTATPNPTPSPSPSATRPPSPTPTATTTATATPTATAPPKHTPRPRPSRPPR
jgi:hypothetical protein